MKKGIIEPTIDESLKKNILLYYGLFFFREFMFMAPIVVLFFQDVGLSMTNIFVLQSLFSLFVFLFEIPSGTFSDKFGEKKTLLIGILSIVVGAVFYGISSTFLGFVIAEFLWAVGLSFLSGSDSAFIYSTLVELKKESDFKKVKGNANSFKLVGAGFGALLGGFIGAYSFRLAFFLSALSAFIAFIFVLLMKEPRDHLKYQRPHYTEILKESFKFIKKHKLVLWYLIFLGVILSYNFLFLLYQPYLIETGIPIELFGIIYLSFNVVAAFSSRFSHYLESKFNEQSLWIFFIVLFLIPLFGMPFFVGTFSFLFILLHQVIRGSFNPIIEHKILNHTFENKRATVLSAGSFFSRVLKALMYPFIGLLVDAKGLLNSIFYIGIIYLPIFVILMLTYFFIPKKYFQSKKIV